ncbi:MAG: sigma factor [Planctomycetota bacterium]
MYISTETRTDPSVGRSSGDRRSRPSRKRLEGKHGVIPRARRSYQEPIYRFAYGLIGDREESEDIVQETFLSAFNSLKRYDANRAKFLTWLF